ncbi:hypothetical protein A4X13_0g2064 [Tilletia indica]|uniref:Uncharacterized protein n=1 Tax=Tilletia indica TaxID=43049 RepID=A0A177TIA3_9BASI|nr:hypothetical protein A4X13_0g2064 [Tilletia indica]
MSATNSKVASAAAELCFCSKPLPPPTPPSKESEDEPSIYCSRECARIDAMRALELRAMSTPPQPTPSTSFLGSDLLLHLIHSDILGGDSSISPLSAAISFSSSAASAGSGAASPLGVVSSVQGERKSGHLRAKGSHYRAMAAAAEAEEERTHRNMTQSHFSWTSDTDSEASGQIEHGLLLTEVASGHTPRIGSGDGKDNVALVTEAEHTESSESHFMENVLAHLRHSSSGSPTLAQLLPAFDAEPILEVAEVVPPPPVNPRISALTSIVAAKGLGSHAQSAKMETTMSTQSDQTLVEPGTGIIPALNYTKEVFSPLSSASRSTGGHWSRPSDASTMTAASTSSFSSVSSTRSMVQARQLRKELDCELRQMALDLAELRQRERDAMIYGISHDRHPMDRRASQSSLDWNEENDEDDGDVFEFDDRRMDEAKRIASLLAQQPAAPKRESGYRWSKSDRQLVARCLSTCIPIKEDSNAAPAIQAESIYAKPTSTGITPSSSCTRGWNGVKLGKEKSLNSIVPGIEVDLAYFLDSEDEEDELLRPTYELPVGFLNQPLERGSSRNEEPLTSKRASGRKSLHHSRSTPLLLAAGPTSATVSTTSSQYLQVNSNVHEEPGTQFEIMAIAPLQLPARPSSSRKSGQPTLTQRKSRNNLFGLFDSSTPTSSGQSSKGSQVLRSVASSSVLRSVVSRGQGQTQVPEQEKRSTILARGPVASGRPSTPSSPFKATFAAAFNRSPRSAISSRPLPAPPSHTGDSPPYNVYSCGQGIGHDPFGAGGGALNKRLPVTPAGVGVGVNRAKALDRLQGLLKRRIMAATNNTGPH